MKKAIAVAMLVMGSGVVMHSYANAADKAKKGTATVVAAPSLKWADVPNAAGVQIATVEGDGAKGPHHFYLKFVGGFSAPAHHHTTDHFGTVVSGTILLTVDGKEQRLPPGSFFSFHGKAPHATTCEAGADCVMFIDARGKWDVVMEDAKAPKM